MFVVPASIDERFSSGSVAVQEGRDVNLTCSVSGIPEPEVTWYRRARAGRLTEEDEEQCQLTTGMDRPSYYNGRLVYSSVCLSSPYSAFPDARTRALAPLLASTGPYCVTPCPPPRTPTCLISY